MNVMIEKSLSPTHKLKFGIATSSKESKSIRKRYTTTNGGFSPRSSNEIPIDDLIEIMQFAFVNNLLGVVDCADICRRASESIIRTSNPKTNPGAGNNESI